MRILYGVASEGLGHATRSKVVIEHLLAAGHQVHVVSAGRAAEMLARRVPVHPVEGLRLAYDANVLKVRRSVVDNLKMLPSAIAKSRDAAAEVRRFDPELIFSDFESWSAAFGLQHGLPVVSLDNIQVLDRCQHASTITAGQRGAFYMAKTAAKLRVPRACHYLVTSFFTLPVRKGRTTLVPPLLRPEIRQAKRRPGEHIVVYLRAAAIDNLLEILAQVPATFRVYGLGNAGSFGNSWVRDFSERDFIDDLASARAVIGAGGFGLMSEAVHLGVPMLSIPIDGQFEQEMNARYLEQLGYGRHASNLTPAHLRDFLTQLPKFEQSLARRPRLDHAVTLACVDELLARLERGERYIPELETIAATATPRPEANLQAALGI